MAADRGAWAGSPTVGRYPPRSRASRPHRHNGRGKHHGRAVAQSFAWAAVTAAHNSAVFASACRRARGEAGCAPRAAASRVTCAAAGGAPASDPRALHAHEGRGGALCAGRRGRSNSTAWCAGRAALLSGIQRTERAAVAAAARRPARHVRLLSLAVAALGGTFHLERAGLTRRGALCRLCGVSFFDGARQPRVAGTPALRAAGGGVRGDGTARRGQGARAAATAGGWRAHRARPLEQGRLLRGDARASALKGRLALCLS
eukprot:6088091-Prymnesium_polylepis.2